MDRRGFLIKAAASAAAFYIAPSKIAFLYADEGGLYKRYESVKLVDKEGRPVTVDSLKTETAYLFNYPYVSTPSFLIKLSSPCEKEVKLKSADGKEYIWKGGVGENRNIVAFSAICPHQMTYPTREQSFIAYVPSSEKTSAYERGGVIVCSSHMSVFDPSKGAKVLKGEACEPLASIVLEIRDDGSIWAVGVLGPQKFHSFFRAFRPELRKQFGSSVKAKKLVKIYAPVVTLSEYSKDIIKV
ncbi:Rieske 2Fe-2S domain-containing protein [Nitrosophilus alvini]|uniref:Rieske 2Fe-2S domain-containing protein n=1 Tax=Nitrosophilus alvini TaxID=2714855 RepID=UPI00190AC402|nr:Rieske 2Fe-2S domain-containing protein [Nitrosophilus alvini]